MARFVEGVVSGSLQPGSTATVDLAEGDTGSDLAAVTEVPVTNRDIAINISLSVTARMVRDVSVAAAKVALGAVATRQTLLAGEYSIPVAAGDESLFFSEAGEAGVATAALSYHVIEDVG